MDNQFKYKWSRKTINGQIVAEDNNTPSAPPSSLELTSILLSENGMDPDSLNENQCGRLSSIQFMDALKAIAFNIIIIAGVILLMLAVTVGFSAISGHDLFSALLPCTGAIVMLFVVAWIYSKRNSGVERYGADSIPVFLQRLLLVLDLILWRVSKLEGNVIRDKREIKMSQDTDGSIRSHEDMSITAPSRTIYVYRIGNKEFRTTEKGYGAFPDSPRLCRIYHLPLSEVMVNIEVL